MVPRFTYSPASPREHDEIYFDASSSSDPDSQIVAYSWQFGDGTSGTGRQTTHSYDLAGTYGVVLTVRDAYGTSVSTPATAVSITTSAAPVARFTLSPTDPRIGTTVVFNAAGSTASAGRRIVGYNWDLGDGTFVEGVAVSHAYAAPGSYTVVLSVTDDGGRKGVSSQTLTIDDLDAPVAAFTVSPSAPAPGTLVVFNAAGSTVAFGRTIVSYDWDFGDGSPKGSGATPTHVYSSEGTFTVVLTVTDNLGRKGVKSSTVNVKTPFGAAPFLDFDWEPIR
jgi:PKD repeat protein